MANVARMVGRGLLGLVVGVGYGGDDLGSSTGALRSTWARPGGSRWRASKRPRRPTRPTPAR